MIRNRTQELDFIRETNDRLTIGQVKLPSLDQYDRSDIDGEDADILLGLVRWADRFVPA